MSPEKAAARASRDLSAGTAEETLLRVYDEAIPSVETLINSVVAQESARSPGLLAKLFDDFLDRGAARRFEHYAASHA
jgi:hypothetical protein